MGVSRIIDYWISRALLKIRKHLDFREHEYFIKQFKKRVGADPEQQVNLMPPVFVVGEEFIRFQGRFTACPGARIECIRHYEGEVFLPHMVFGDNVVLNYYCHIGCINEIIVGNNVLLGSRVLITDHQHGLFVEDQKDVPWSERPLSSKGPVHIEDNVWLGENVCVMPGVTIGKGSVIGANSVVTHDIPPYSMAVGIPAKVIKTLI